MKDPVEALERFEKLIESIESGSEEGAIVVEGRRDEKALRELGVEGNIRVINRGVSLLQFCEELSREERHVVLLVDWDAKGDELAEKLRGGLAHGGLEVDLEIRKGLRSLAWGSIKAVEELASFYRRVRAAAAAKGPERQEPRCWRVRKEARLRRQATRKQHGAPPGRRP